MVVSTIENSEMTLNEWNQATTDLLGRKERALKTDQLRQKASERIGSFVEDVKPRSIFKMSLIQIERYIEGQIKRNWTDELLMIGINRFKINQPIEYISKLMVYLGKNVKGYLNYSMIYEGRQGIFEKESVVYVPYIDDRGKFTSRVIPERPKVARWELDAFNDNGGSNLKIKTFEGDYVTILGDCVLMRKTDLLEVEDGPKLTEALKTASRGNTDFLNQVDFSQESIVGLTQRAIEILS